MPKTAPKAEPVLLLRVSCAAPENIGRLDGGMARMIPITGGTVSGEIEGEVLPGGADWAIVRKNGLSTVDARYAFKASDGTIIQVFNGATALIERSQTDRPYMMVTSPRFIAPEGPHDWLNRGVFVGTLAADMSAGGSAVEIRIFRMV